MKNIEQKAKAYDEALERAKYCLTTDMDKSGHWAIKHIFPVLKESGDEKIRKSIIELVEWVKEQQIHTDHNTDDTKWDDMIAWLEKQGEQTIISSGSNSASVSDGDTSVTSKEVVSYPTTSTTFKPKFKVGDFIVNDYCMGRVVELTNDAYLLDTEQGIPFSYEHNVHLWTIEDAKDSDIIYIKRCKNDSEWLLIFKKIKSQNNYIDVYDYYAFSITTGSVYHDFNEDWGLLYDGDIVRPATKEQSHTLFAKMKDAGYEWDADKKELKLLITNGGDFCQENCKGFQETGKCFADGDCEAKINAEKKELKKCVIDEGKAEMDHCFTKMINGEKVSSTWSEEDDRTLGYLLAVLEDGIPTDSGKMGKIIDWLKSLKERIGG